MATIVGIVLALGLSARAQAQCAGPYTADAMLGDLATVEDFLRKGDNDAAGKAANQMQTNLACLSETVPPILLGRAYRAMGGGLYVIGDLQHSQGWFSTALVIDPTFDYGTEDLPPNHPVISVYQETRRVGFDDPVTVEGKAFAPGVHYLDGKKITTPTAHTFMPHLYQWQHEDGTIATFIIDGNAFPEEALGKPGGSQTASNTPEGNGKPEKVKPPKNGTTTPPPPTDTVTTIKRQRPPEKTPLMIGGGVVVVGAGGLYFLAMQSRDHFDGAGTVDDLHKYRGATNRFVVFSGVALALGAGTVTWGIIVEDSTPIPTIQMRF